LEFKNVFVVGLEENLFPSPMSSESVRGLEEERRLFYVAITRAEEHCYLSFAKSRFRFGKTEMSSPSRFLKDIDVRFLSLPQGEQMAQRVDEGALRFRQQMGSSSNAPRGGFVTRSQSLVNRYGGEESRPTVQPQSFRTLKKVSSIAPSRPALSPEAAGSLQAGNVIEHERFGIGDVVAVVGAGDNCKATVKFRNAGEKQLLLKFARFKVIG